MKKFTLVSFAIAAVLAISPTVVVAQVYDFTASGIEGNGQAVNITATFDLTSLGGGTYLLTGASGSVLDPWGNTLSITGVISAGSPGTVGYSNPYQFDNLVTIPAAYAGQLTSGLSYFDGYGILLSTSNPGYYVGVAPNEYYADGNYQFADNGLNGSVTYPLAGNWPYDTADVTVSLTRVPDGGTTLALLGLAIAGLAGLRRKLSA
jgi:hypothetical protein